MNNKPSHINTFEDGMWSDFDAQQVSNKTYIEAFNGRVIFNENGTLAFENAAGTKLALTLGFDYGAATEYQTIGFTYIDNKLIIFSTKNTVSVTGQNSEIGFITENQVGNYVYQTAFNDKYDPNGQLLRFSTRWQIKSNGSYENKDLVLSYWNDDKSDPRVFNIVAGLTSVNPEFTNGNYNPLTGTGKYPNFYSVHGMDRMCDVQFGLIKYIKNITGNLTSGQRFYAYRLVHKSRYATPWSPLSSEIFVTSDQVNEFDWNQYRMTASAVQTNKGHQLEIKYIDTRFQYLEVACVLYYTDVAPERADIIFRGNINGTSMIISHTDNTGIEPILDVSLLVQRYTDSKHEKTQVINENHYHTANIFLRPNLEINTENITVIPKIRRMISDELGGVTLAPLTHQVPKTTTVTQQLFAGFQEQYTIDNDYINWKGTQWNSIFKSDFRESIYPFAIVLFNRKGQPCFAQHIGDFTTPPQYSNNWTLRKATGTTTGTTGGVDDYVLTNYDPGSTYPITDTINQGDNFVIQMLGTVISGIDLTNVIYDEYGEIQISGFSIVRTDRIPDIIGQGVVINCSIPSPYEGEAVLYPHKSSGNRYDFAEGNFTYSSLISGTGNTIEQFGQINSASFLRNRIKGGLVTFECPDFMIDPTIVPSDISYYLRVIGNCQAAFLPNAATGINGSPPIQLDGNHGHFYTKQYTTYKGVTWWNATVVGPTEKGVEPFADYGMEINIAEIVVDVFREDNRGIGNGYYIIKNGKVPLCSFYAPLTEEENFFSSGHDHSIYMNLLNGDNRFVNLSSWYTPWGNLENKNNICYFISNYRTGYPNYDITPNVLANRIYKNIGHFIPINAQTIAAATQPDGTIVFNDLEVWGGDCFPDYFAYTRLYPLYTECATPTRDYAFGLVFPVESKFNHTLRNGSFYSKDGTRPEATECKQLTTPVTSMWQDGMFISDTDTTYHRYEDFDVNSVLQATDKISSYNVKSIYFREEDDQPLLEMVSRIKINGEFIDSYRYFLVNDNQQADGKLGYITDLESIGINLYVLQEKGFGRIRFNERTMLTTDAQNLTVGTGQGYQGHDYIDFQAGCQHQFSVVNSGRSIYWLDANKGKSYRFGQDGLNKVSDLRGQHNYFFNNLRNFWQIPTGILTDVNENVYDNPCDVGGISAIVDFKNNSVYWTFTKRKEVSGSSIIEVGTPSTIEYSESENQFKQKCGFTPRMYFNLRQNFLSADPANPNKIYVHNEGMKGHIYGAFQETRIKFSSNPDFRIDKVMDNAKFNFNPDGYKLAKQVILTNEDQTQIVNFNDPSDNRPDYREKYLIYPTMENNQGVRMRGKYLILEYIFDNGANAGQDTLLRITSHEQFFRKSFR